MLDFRGLFWLSSITKSNGGIIMDSRPKRVVRWTPNPAYHCLPLIGADIMEDMKAKARANFT